MKQNAALVYFYYALALIGLVATWTFNAQYLLNGGGLGPQAFFGAAFSNSLTTAITIDVYIATLVFSVWTVSEARRVAVKWPWCYVALCFSVGLAIALPLYLAQREKRLNANPGSA